MGKRVIKYALILRQKQKRYKTNSVPHILDLVLSNEEEMISDLRYLPGLGLSDHVCLQFMLECYCGNVQQLKPRYDTCHADFDKMRQLLGEIDWENILGPMDIHSAWKFFTTKFTEILNECIPFDFPRSKKNLFMTNKARIKNVNYGTNIY